MTEKIDPKFLLSLTGLTPDDLKELHETNRPKQVVRATTKRGWSSAGLPVIYGEDDRFWTVNEAIAQLGKPILSAGQLRSLIRLHGLQPCGKKRTTKIGTSGRYSRVYKAEELIKLHDTLTIK